MAVVMLGAGISIAIELLQVFLPTRDSSLTDVAANVLGTYVGIRLYRTAQKILFGCPPLRITPGTRCAP